MKDILVLNIKFLYSFFLSIWLGLFCKKINLPKASKEKCYVLGNGPSLTKDIAGKEDFLATQDIFVVNHFAKTDLFLQLKPAFYVFADPAFWEDVKDPFTKEKVNKTLEVLKMTVDWHLTLFAPSNAVSALKKKMSENTFIQIQAYGKQKLDYSFRSLRYLAYRKNVAMPHAQTVMNAALFLAINMEYKEINVLGIDHNWFKNLVLDDDNVLYFNDTHFYNEAGDSKTKAENNITGHAFLVHEELRFAADALESHHKINDYALYKGATIYNYTSTSFVDAYPRKKII